MQEFKPSVDVECNFLSTAILKSLIRHYCVIFFTKSNLKMKLWFYLLFFSNVSSAISALFHNFMNDIWHKHWALIITIPETSGLRINQATHKKRAESAWTILSKIFLIHNKYGHHIFAQESHSFVSVNIPEIMIISAHQVRLNSRTGSFIQAFITR